MVLNIQVKQMGKKGRHIKPLAMEYAKRPENARQLIEETVRMMVADYKCRLRERREGRIPEALSEENMQTMAEVGKIAFGDIYNDKEPDEEKAVQTAWQAYADGIVRVFVNGTEAEYNENGTALALKEGDEISFVRLAMLAGRMF
ncbi:MAG: hypothetical protein K5697_12040 [Lachnospiraceae bacterium]|nr:hypothetical protein [Lachnospiraceae bacterium]